MLLKALEIQGFKSFPDRTKVTIDKGITAVVGPNGSGKSNISDAIRWVLGETSAKQLRGGGKMENVIFGGTQKRSAMGYASVNLYIDNTDRRIAVDTDEVVIGRKYYRSGDSNYSINGQNVRLKDVYELFLDTGIGRDGYSIIGQGRIAEIVGAKSAERREIFEEASGIARYRYRKNEAERRLASAEDNLVRLRDILAELESRVGPLEKEAKKAEQFVTLATQRKELEVTLWVDTVHRARDTVREQQRKIEMANADYAQVSDEVTAIDAATEAVRAEIQGMIVQAERMNADMRAITSEISGADAQIAVLYNDIAHNDATVQSLQQEISDMSAGNESIVAEVEQHLQTIASCEAHIASMTQRTQTVEAMLHDLQTKTAESGERRGLLAEKLMQMAEQATDYKVAIASAQSAIAASHTRKETASVEQTTVAQTLQTLTQEKQEATAFLKETNETLTRLENIKNGLSLKLNVRSEQLAKAQDSEQTLHLQIEATSQRVTVLQDLERNMDGFQHSVKHVMKAAQNHRLRGIVGPVSTIISVKDGYEVAIETALGFALQNIVVEHEGAAKSAMALLRDDRAGRATFLPLDTIKGSTFDASRLTGSAVRASDLVTYDAKYANIITNLLGRIVVVDDINEASQVARRLDYRNRIVTVDGQVINAGGSFTGGSVSRSAGLFSRKQEITDLTQKLQTLQEQRTQAQEKCDKLKAEVDAISAEHTATESEIITHRGDKIRGEMECARVDSAYTQAQAATQLLLAECEQITAQIAQNEALVAQTQQASEQLAIDSTALETEMQQISGTDDAFLTTRSRLTQELSDLKLQCLSAEKDIENHRTQVASLQMRTGSQTQRAATLTENIDTLTAQNEQNKQSIAHIEQTTADSHVRIKTCEETIATLATQRMEKEGSVRQETLRARQLMTQREEISREVARLTEQKEQKDAEYEQTVAKLWEEYELTLFDAENLATPFESVTELRRNVAQVRNQIRALGHVNVGAIEEYAEVRTRYDFMKAQVDDVEQSKAELVKMITSLSEEMRAIFTDSFAQINRNFARIFTELFGGGSARLSLEEGADILTSGINIEVAPPGKIIKDLSALSGGEQALVAISIYFAILAVNPAPFCVLDEIEAALDDVNVVRYAQYLRRITADTQFIVITHRRGTMEEADVLYGVTMQEDGVSKLLKLNVNNVDASLVS